MIALYKHERDIADWFSTLVSEKLIIVWEANLKLSTSKKWKENPLDCFCGYCQVKIIFLCLKMKCVCIQLIWWGKVAKKFDG